MEVKGDTAEINLSRGKSEHEAANRVLLDSAGFQRSPVAKASPMSRFSARERLHRRRQRWHMTRSSAPAADSSIRKLRGSQIN
jgi:hypothetical protein